VARLPRFPRRRWIAASVAVAGVAVAVLFLRRSLPGIADMRQAIAAASAGWLGVAAVAQVASIAMFALQQRWLLVAYGGRMSVRRSMGLTVARTAISIALPGGAAVSGGYAVAEFRRRGSDVASATAMIVLAGAQSLGALALVYLVWFAAVGYSAAGGSAPVHAGYAAVLVGACVGGVYAGRWLLGRDWRVREAPPERAGAIRRRVDELAALAADTVRTAASLSTKDWATGSAYAMGNWVLDIACLLFTARAFGLRVGLLGVVGAWLAVQLVRQIPVTPGGIGIVEAGLIVALVAAGATGGTAAAVVLTYRILSCWLIAPIGMLAWVGLQASDRRAEDSGAEDSGAEEPGAEEPNAVDRPAAAWEDARAEVRTAASAR
jgi:putative heme transporter